MGEMMNVYLFLADGFEMIEALTVVDVLRRAGVNTTTVSISEELKVRSSHNVFVEADQVFEACDFSNANLFVLPGGLPGTTNLEAHSELIKLLERSIQKGVKIAAICAAPSILGKKGWLQGKDATAYPGFDQYLLGANVKNQTVVVDGNFITARGMGATINFSLTILQQLGLNDQAEEIGQAIQFTQYYK